MNRDRGMIWKRRSLAVACASVAASMGTAAEAQQDPAPDSRADIKVFVTGTHIPRSDAESALPVQVITREEIERSGATTVAEVMSKVSANVLGASEQLAVTDFAGGGLSSVNLRAMGDGSTLVLLNGRRLANYAFNGGAVDVNSIPLAAIDRIEILKDGASAIYGSDAIAGVVNFILRKDFRGVELTAYGSWTQHGGGDQRQAIGTFGYGDLAKDRFNVFLTASYQKDDALHASERSFTRTGFRPDQSVLNLPPTTFPANIFTFPPSRLHNPSFASGCAPPSSLPTTIANTPGDACGFDSTSFVDIIPEVERSAVYARGTFQLAKDHQLFAEVGYSLNRLAFTVDPTPVANFENAAFEPLFYPAGGPFYPTAFANANGISGDLNLVWRTVPLGSRLRDVETSAWRAVIGADGTVSNWNYATALSYSRTQQSNTLRSGHVSMRRLVDAMATGLINPFGPSGSEGDALLAQTQVAGEVQTGKGTTLAFDVKASRDLMALPGGQLAIAVGAEARREELENLFDPLITSGDVIGVRVAFQPKSGDRSVQAVFAEAILPFAKGFEAQLAARYDHYSDFGGTVNPKVALRWQPLKTLLFRTSWGTGFRAPPLYDLYEPQVPFTLLFEGEDPLRCPITGAPRDCVFFSAVAGGNPNLEPEKSEQFNLGVVWEPSSGLSFGVDYWYISKKDFISAVDSFTIFDNIARFGSTHIIRGPVDPEFPGLPGPIELVLVNLQNVGKLRTSGIDLNVNWRGPATSIGRFSFALNGTYLINWKWQPDGVHWESAVGGLAIGPLPRWKHHASMGWERGPWSGTLAQTFQSGYEDLNFFPPRVLEPPPPRRVSSYNVWDLQGRYTGFRNATLAFGIKNLFDQDPPFTNHIGYAQFGYDPSYADPRGRTFYASVTYAFK